MQAAHRRLPPLPQMIRDRRFDFHLLIPRPRSRSGHSVSQTARGSSNTNRQFRSNERVDRQDHIKEFRGEGKRSCVGMDRENTLIRASIADSLQIFCGIEPQISGPNLHAEFAVQKNRRSCPPAAEIEHPKLGSKLQRRSQPFREPKRRSSPAYAGRNPSGTVGRRTRKPGRDETLIHRRWAPPASSSIRQQAIACRRQTPESKSQSELRTRSTAAFTDAALLSFTYSYSSSRSAAECSRSASMCTVKYS